MAAPPVKSQPLHNFTFPHLNWARKSNPSSSSSAAAHHRFRRRDSPDQHPEPDQQSPDASPGDDVVPEAVEDDNGEGKGWNLRPRKTVVKTASVLKKETGSTENNNKTNGVIKSQRLQNGGVERNGKRKVWISLSKEEIEEDIYALTGGKPARRPRKWPRNVQKQLDNVFPGLYLVGVAADSYRVTML